MSVFFSNCLLAALFYVAGLEKGNAQRDAIDPMVQILEAAYEDWLVLSPDDAIRICTDVLARETLDNQKVICALYSKRAAAYEVKDKLDLALKDLDRLQQMSESKDLHVNWRRAGILVRMGQVNEARRELEKIIQENPGYARGYSSLAACEIAEGRMRSAAELVTKAISFDPSFAQAYYIRAYTRLTEKKYVECLDDLNRAIALKPLSSGDCETIYVMRARVLFTLGRNAECMESLKMAKRLNPESLAVLAEIRRFYEETGNPQLAALTTQEMARIAPNQLVTLLACAESYSEVGRSEEAESAAQKAMQIAPNNPEVNYAWGTILVRNKRQFAEAVRYFDKVLTASPNHYGATCAKAFLLVACPTDELRDHKTAIQLARSVCDATNWTDPRPIMLLAGAYAEGSEFEEANRFADLALATCSAPGKRKEQYEQLLEPIRRGKPIRVK